MEPSLPKTASAKTAPQSSLKTPWKRLEISSGCLEWNGSCGRWPYYVWPHGRAKALLQILAPRPLFRGISHTLLPFQLPTKKLNKCIWDGNIANGRSTTTTINVICMQNNETIFFGGNTKHFCSTLSSSEEEIILRLQSNLCGFICIDIYPNLTGRDTALLCP